MIPAASERPPCLIRRGVPTLLLALCLSAGPVLAQAPAPGDSWIWAHFTTRDGLPSDVVFDAATTSDGTFWSMGRGGIAYFDGFLWRHRLLPGGLEGQSVAISTDPDGHLIVLADGRLVVMDRTSATLTDAAADGGDHRFRSAAGLTRGPVLLLGHDDVLYEWDGRRCRRHAPADVFGRVHNLYPAGPTSAWISTDRGVWCWDGTKWRQRFSGSAQPYDLTGVVELSDERAWAYVGSPLSAVGLWSWNAANVSVGLRQPILSPAVSLAVGTAGELFAAHISGEVTILRNGTWSPLTTRFTGIADAHAIGVRPGGDVWVATDRGLFLYRRSAVRWTLMAFPSADGRNGVNDIYRGRDGLWLATAGGLVRVQRNNTTEHITQAGAEPLASVTGVTRDGQGRLWICSGGAFTGVRWLDAGGWHRLRTDSLLDRSFVHRVATDRKGGVWFLGVNAAPGRGDPPGRLEPGAFRLAPDGTVSRWGVAEGLQNGRVYAFAEGLDGAYWFGTGAGLSRWAGGQWTHWNRANGLALDKVFSVAVDPVGTVWFGHQTGGGLGSLRGDRVTYVTSNSGLPSDDVWSVAADGDGRVWVSCLGGLSVFERGNWTTFGAAAGLRSTRVWPVLPAADHVYVGTNGGGLAILSLTRPSPPPIVTWQPPVLESSAAVVDWQAFSWWGELAPEDVPTRVKLDDGPWSAWSTIRSQHFSGLRPGAHTIRIQAKSLLGHVGPVTAVDVAISEPFYRRPVFYVPVAVLALAVLGLMALTTVRQRRHHREISERERLFSQIFHSSPLPAAISSIDDGRYIDINDAFLKRFGFSRPELIGRTPAEAGLDLPVADRAQLVARLADPAAEHWIETTVRRKSRQIAALIIYAEIINVEGRPALFTQALDVSEQRRLETQLRQSHKMESVGRLAGGIAHDFNNLLTVIWGNVTLLEEGLPAGDARRAEVDQIRTAAARAEKLTRQLLAFARKQVVEPRAISLGDLVLRTDAMLRRLIGEDIELVTMIAPDLLPAFVDPGQIEQVLVNMAVNARDAMPGGGTLTIRASNFEFKTSDPAREPDTAPGPYVRLSIIDTGSGMDEQTAAQAFDPFFTTKEAGKGTGLGLATCYGIVKQAGGQITLVTSPGRGTTFHVDVPASASSPATDEAAPEPVLDLSFGRETVLLVEDEAQVRKIAATVLRQRGYTVLEAGDGPDALQAERGHDGAIDILVTDVVMPQMRGTELARRFAARRPAAKILFMSGFIDDDDFRQEVGVGPSAFLAKPFSPAELAKKVREQLDRSVRQDNEN